MPKPFTRGCYKWAYLKKEIAAKDDAVGKPKCAVLRSFQMNQEQIAKDTNVAVGSIIQKKWQAFGKLFWAIFIPLLLTVLGQYILKHITATKDLEFKILHSKLSDYLPQNLDEVAQISLDKKLYSDLHIYSIQFWNRTDADVGRMRIRIVPKGEAVTAVHKLLLRTPAYDPDWIKWAFPGDLNRWDIIADFTRINWEPAANYSVRLFTANELKDGFDISTNEPGIRFEPFAIEREHWWLFGLDGIIYALIFWTIVGVVFYGMVRLTRYLNKKIIDNYIDIVALTVNKNYPELSRETRIKMLLVAAYAYSYSIDFAIWRKKNVKALVLPKETDGAKPPTLD